MHKPLVSRITSKNISARAVKKAVSRQTTEYLRESGCSACPMTKLPNGCPEMPFIGPKDADIYVLLSDVSTDDLEEKEYLVNTQILDNALNGVPVRYGVCVRGQAKSVIDIKAPKDIISHCCSSSIIEDIVRVKPKVIIACGMAATSWVLPGAVDGIYAWRGRMAPTKIGTHSCWVAPVMDPEDVDNLAKNIMKIPPKEWKKAFHVDVRRAISRSKKKVVIKVPDIKEIKQGIRYVIGVEGDLAKVKKHLKKMAGKPLVTFDIETSCLRPYTKGAKILSIAVGTGKDVLAFPIDHPRDKWTIKKRRSVKKYLLEFLMAKIKKVGQSTDFDLEWLLDMFGPSFMQFGSWHDSQAQAYILDNRASLQSLDALCLINFGFNLKVISNVNRKNCLAADLKDLLIYNALDVKWTHKVFLKQLKLLKKRGMLSIYNMQAKRSKTIAYSQNIGIPIDQERGAELSKELKKKEDRALDKLLDMDCVKLYKKRCGKTFSPTSSPACVVLFRDILKVKWEGKGKFSADKTALKLFDHPAAKQILSYRAASKRRGTYVDNMLVATKGSNVYPDGKLHVSFNSTFTDTGRFSTSGPNLNWPKREGKETRTLVVPPPRDIIASYDYGQIEARVAGMVSKDKKYCKSLWDRFDIHMHWAEVIVKAYPKILDKYEGTQKERIKTFRGYVKNQFVFPVIYGSMMESAARNLQIPPKIFSPVYNEFWETYSTIRKWQKELIEFYKHNFYVESLTGRRRYGPLNMNMVCNTPVQGPASDIVVDAMDRISEIAVQKDMPCLQPVMNIHDDLTFFLPNKSDKYEEIIIEQMLNVPFDWVNVPITIECEKGKNWCDMKKAGEFSSDQYL